MKRLCYFVLSLLSFALPAAAFAGIAEDNVQYSAHLNQDVPAVTCSHTAPVTFADGFLNVDWSRLALHAAAGALASPVTNTSGEVVVPASPLKCERSDLTLNP